ncbi:hypothetical protein [Flavobacterium sp.]|uniref:hypothetical protein n=1 Tax=Flavobacterium sp. TaxID=239 RepID=UPI004033F73D
MTQHNETFESLIAGLRPQPELLQVFEDFLTLSLWSLCVNPKTGRPDFDALDTAILERYSDTEVKEKFPKMLVLLVKEMDGRVRDGRNADVLGDFYRTHLCDGIDVDESADTLDAPLADIRTMAGLRGASVFLDSACGTGRKLLQASDAFGRQHFYWGVEEDPVRARIAAFNLLLAGQCSGEITCGSLVEPRTFVFGYRFSHDPDSLQPIRESEHSLFWSLYFRK